MGDFKFNGSLYGLEAPSETLDVVAGGTATVAIGDLVRIDDGNAGYVKKCANGDTNTLCLEKVWLAVSASDETASADGTVKAMTCPYMRLLGTVTTPANLLQALINTRVTLDVSAGTQKIDENHTTNGFMRIKRPVGGASCFDTTNGYDTEVVVNEAVS